MRVRDEDKVRLVKQKALEHMSTYGFEGFSMNKLAKDCDISVATLYIYYKDKDDLIISIAKEEGDRMADMLTKDFDPNASFEDGMRIQWRNRFDYLKQYSKSNLFFEQLRTSSYQERFLENFMSKFKTVISEFMHNIVAKGEIAPMPLEVFWSIAYAPLYSLVRFDQEGHSIGGKSFKMSDEIFWKTFDLVIKALKN